MRDDICSIPVSEVFDVKEGCPICRMRNMLESRIVEYVLGAAMMEPDVRIATNERGFCHTHLKQMMKAGKRLPLALILESHLAEIEKDVFKKGKLKTADKKSAYKAARTVETCFVCDKVEWGMERMLDTVLRLYSLEYDFRDTLKEQEYLCLPHYQMLADLAVRKMDKKKASPFLDVCKDLALNYLQELQGDVTHFTKMFDYRSNDENADWGNSKDSIERSCLWLTGREGE